MKYVPNEYTGKSLMMAKKKMKESGRAMYNQGSYVSIQEMERHCGGKTVLPTAKGYGDKSGALEISVKVKK